MSNDLMQVITSSLLSKDLLKEVYQQQVAEVCEVWTFVFSNKINKCLAVKGALMFSVLLEKNLHLKKVLQMRWLRAKIKNCKLNRCWWGKKYSFCNTARVFLYGGVTLDQICCFSGSASSQLTLLILLLLSAVRNDMLLISLITTKFCSSRLKFCNRQGWGRNVFGWVPGNDVMKWGRETRLTWDLDQKMKTSPTIRNSSSASGSGHVSHLALQWAKSF